MRLFVVHSLLFNLLSTHPYLRTFAEESHNFLRALGHDLCGRKLKALGVQLEVLDRPRLGQGSIQLAQLCVGARVHVAQALEALAQRRRQVLQAVVGDVERLQAGQAAQGVWQMLQLVVMDVQDLMNTFMK